MDPTAIIIGCIIALPLLWFVGGILFKIIWGFAPIIAGISCTGWMLWSYGEDGILIAILAPMAGIIAAWFWQRTRFYLAVDAWIEKTLFFGG